MKNRTFFHIEDLYLNDCKICKKFRKTDLTKMKDWLWKLGKSGLVIRGIKNRILKGDS